MSGEKYGKNLMRVNLIPKLDKFGMNETFFRFLFLIKAHNNNTIVKNRFHMIDKKIQ